MKFALILSAVLLGLVCLASGLKDQSSSSSPLNKPKHGNNSMENSLEKLRVKRGYGHGGGGGGGGHGGGYGHGPGAGGGARGPVYFCGWVGSKMGSGGYGYGR